MAEGFAVRRTPIGMHQGEFVRSPCCPLWGKCRNSGKGGVVGDFEPSSFIEQHPLSQPCRFRSAVKSASSPIGEPSPTSPERFSRCSRPRRRTAASCKAEDGASRRRGFRRYAEYHCKLHQGESVPAPLASPGGVAERSESFNNNDCRWQSYPDLIAGSLDGSSKPARLTEEGWRQPKYCLHFVQWYQPKMIADYFPLFSFICNMEKGFHKTSTLLHSPNSS